MPVTPMLRVNAAPAQPSQAMPMLPDSCRSGRKKTMSQTYQPGQIVRLQRVGLSKRDASANDLYEVIRLMPADQNGEIAYRVKSLNAGERAVREGEIMAYISED